MAFLHSMGLRLAATALVIPLGGCGDGEESPARPIDGAVTVDGLPLAEATIRFLPVDPSSGRPASAEVRNGSFRFGPEAEPVPGRYRVVISGRPADGAGTEPLPAEYNARTILAAEVKPDGPNSYHFPLASKVASRAESGPGR